MASWSETPHGFPWSFLSTDIIVVVVIIIIIIIIIIIKLSSKLCMKF